MSLRVAGHPLHPMLTDLPIGFWTSAWVLDLIGGERHAPSAELLTGLGVLSVLPTAATGAADWRSLTRRDKWLGLVHAACNATAATLYAASWLARRRGDRRRGLVLGHLGRQRRPLVVRSVVSSCSAGAPASRSTDRPPPQGAP